MVFRSFWPPLHPICIPTYQIISPITSANHKPPLVNTAGNVLKTPGHKFLMNCRTSQYVTKLAPGRGSNNEFNSWFSSVNTLVAIFRGCDQMNLTLTPVTTHREITRIGTAWYSLSTSKASSHHLINPCPKSKHYRNV